MSFSDFLLWLTEPSLPPIVFLIWFLSGLLSTIVDDRLDKIRERVKKNENNQ